MHSDVMVLFYSLVLHTACLAQLVLRYYYISRNGGRKKTQTGRIGEKTG